jgi:hypothetical protein
MKKLVLAGVSVVKVLAIGALLAACSEEQASATDNIQAQMAPGADAVQDAAQVSYGPEALETLLAPIALYPDPVLAQVLATSTNPQEVLDAGNWLLQNQALTGSELESAATEVGFTPPMIALVQFPTVVDMMCVEMDWTTELGSAFLADETGVLDAVQRLRKQAADMGNLQSSEQMQVATETQNNQEVIVVQPAQPEVVYVPQYDPAAVYTTPAPTTASVESTTDTGHSTETLVMTGLLAFGAGILVNEVFSDDDDYYYPRWGRGYGGSPYYPPPYRPRYGNGYRPAHGYNRPSNYQHGFNNNNIYVNNSDKNYFKQFDGGRNNYRNKPNSPISAARPNRSELNTLNQRSQAGNRQVQGSYAGAKPKAKERAAASRPTTALKAPTGSYAGARPSARDMTKPQTMGTRDRGRAESSAARSRSPSKPSARPTASRQAPAKRPGGFQGSRDSGRSERAASQRGRASMSHGGRSSNKSHSGQRRGSRR